MEFDFIFRSGPKRRELAKQMLLSVAVNMVLEELSDVDASSEVVPVPIMFTNLSLANVIYLIMLAESDEKGKDPDAVMEGMLKMQDLGTNMQYTLFSSKAYQVQLSG